MIQKLRILIEKMVDVLSSATYWVWNGIKDDLPKVLQNRFDPHHQKSNDILLEASQVYWTDVSVPAQQGHRLSDIAALQLNSLSPLPPDQVDFALGQERRKEKGRVAAKLAIVRTQDLGQVNAIEGHALVARHPDGDRARFEAALTGRQVLQQLFSSRLFLTVLVLLSALISIHLYTKRVMDQVASDRGELIATLRELKAETVALEALSNQDNLMAPTSISSHLQGINFSQNTIITSLSVTRKEVQIRGYTSQQTIVQTPNPAWNIVYEPDPRPDWQRFHATHMQGEDMPW
ncbi:MAG: hypothetical protein AAF603_03685 [Pseudomonadota bacterium]